MVELKQVESLKFHCIQAMIYIDITTVLLFKGDVTFAVNYDVTIDEGLGRVMPFDDKQRRGGT